MHINIHERKVQEFILGGTPELNSAEQSNNLVHRVTTSNELDKNNRERNQQIRNYYEDDE